MQPEVVELGVAMYLYIYLSISVPIAWCRPESILQSKRTSIIYVYLRYLPKYK